MLRILSITLIITASLAAEETVANDRITDLERRLATLERLPPPTAAPGLRLVDLSLNILSAVGGSSVHDEEIAVLQGGGHDPHRRGFSFQGAELSIAGAVDPYFIAEAHLVAIRDEPTGATGIELEEAFVRTTSLPADLEIKAGTYLTEFGRFNPTHPHAWYFIDQPIMVGRVFGGDGQRSPGARVLWSVPTPWYSDLFANVQDANGETMPSFLGDPDAADRVAAGYPATQDASTRSGSSLLYSLRWVNAVDVSDTTIKWGVSGATGPNAATPETRTNIFGADLAAKWHPVGGARGWPFVVFEAELIQRDYQVGDEQALVDIDSVGTITSNGLTAPGGTLHDRGVILQVVWGFRPGWTAGLRYEQVTGSGDSIITVDDGAGGTTQSLDRSQDTQRDDRTRWAPLIGYAPSEFSHFKLQYNYDRADHLDRPAHSVWLGVEFLIGTHPAHVF